VLESPIRVVIVNYNTRPLLHACLSSVATDVPTLVVDNASTDGSAAMVSADFPRVRLIARASNSGYGAAANEAIGACTSRYVLLLNSDTRLEADTITRLTAYLDGHPEVAIAGPQLRNPDGSLQASCFPFPGSMRWLAENEPLSYLTGFIPAWRRRTLRFSPPTVAGTVPWVLGAALAIRREAFQEVGGFDESFFMYFEEVDLCWRLRHAGWQTHVVPDARIVHVGGASTSQAARAMNSRHFDSCLQFYRRHYRGARLAFWLTSMYAKRLVLRFRDSVGS
jgi:GT2 family glycosyltransferase